MDETGPPAAHSGPSNRERARLIGVGLAVAIAVLFAVLNLDEVDVNWIFGTISTPLIVLIAVVFALGFVAGLLLGRRRAR